MKLTARFYELNFCALLALSSAISAHAECPRQYTLPTSPGLTINHEIRLLDGVWKIGTYDSTQAWLALSCHPELELEFYNPNRLDEQEVNGVGNVGLSASVLQYPSLGVPAGVEFSANPQTLFSDHLVEIELPETGKVFLDAQVYAPEKMDVQGVTVELFADATTPARGSAWNTMQLMTSLFPHRSLQIQAQGKVTLVLMRNTTEKFQANAIRANGFHYPKHLFAVLFSQDGDDGGNVYQHSMHEIGGLFRIPLSNGFSQGLTWMIAYDQMQKAAAGPEAQHSRKCGDLARVASNLDQTGTQNENDFSHSVEYYVNDIGTRNGWPLVAWGSAYYWKKINEALEQNGVPTVYQLIDHIHDKGLPEIDPSTTGKNFLEQLLDSYREINLNGSPLFRALALRYFRELKLSDLQAEVRAEQVSSGCLSN